MTQQQWIQTICSMHSIATHLCSLNSFSGLVCYTVIQFYKLLFLMSDLTFFICNSLFYTISQMIYTFNWPGQYSLMIKAWNGLIQFNFVSQKIILYHCIDFISTKYNLDVSKYFCLLLKILSRCCFLLTKMSINTNN